MRQKNNIDSVVMKNLLVIMEKEQKKDAPVMDIPKSHQNKIHLEKIMSNINFFLKK